MTSIKAFIAKHPVQSYFAFTFAISWGGVLLVVGGPAGMTGIKAQDNPLFPLAVLAMVAGPSATALLLTILVDGRRGLRAFRSRLRAWRVAARWYAIAVLAAPVLGTAVALTLSLFSPEFRPGISVAGDKTALLLLGLAVGATAGFVEELGWTGFAIPRLRRRYGVTTTGLIVGLLWSAWHLLVTIWGIGDRAGAIPLAAFIAIDSFTCLPAFRVLMVWVYDRTASLPVAMLMHASLTVTTIVVWPVTKGTPLLVYDIAFALAVWALIAAIAQVNRGQLSRRALRRVA